MPKRKAQAPKLKAKKPRTLTHKEIHLVRQIEKCKYRMNDLEDDRDIMKANMVEVKHLIARAEAHIREVYGAQKPAFRTTHLSEAYESLKRAMDDFTVAIEQTRENMAMIQNELEK